MSKELLETLMAALAIITLAAAMVIFYRAAKKTGAASIKFFYSVLFIMMVWLTAISIMANKGVFNDFSSFPPKAILVPIITFITIVALTFTKPFKAVIKNVSYAQLAGIQVFRVLVELILWGFFTINVLPKQMTFEGGNWDIISGLGGITVALLIVRGKMGIKGILAYNIIGFLLLINILVIAILSMPTPARYFMNEPANTIVATFPMFWLPAILVPIAFAFHVFSVRKYFIEKIFPARQ